MDKQTEIMWEAEFLKQYPQPGPEEILGLQELFEANALMFEMEYPAFVADIEKGHKHPNPYVLLLALDMQFKYVYDNFQVEDMMYESRKPVMHWESWRDECKQRFYAIFSASPVYALEELRKGNLLIEENVHVT